MTMLVLDQHRATEFLRRSIDRDAGVEETVRRIIDDVRSRGDEAVFACARKFDGVDLSPSTVRVATGGSLPDELAAAVDRAMANVEEFARSQMQTPWVRDFGDGRILGQVVRPLERVGVYVPAGRYPLISSLIMAVVPARVAGVQSIEVACPNPTPEVLAVAGRLGILSVLRIGGAQAIAAMAYGTESVPRVLRIVGPGNAWVAEAKRQVAGDVGIDFVAGPSEIMIAANDGDARWIAADMLAQAEHDVAARAILITTSPSFAVSVEAELERQLGDLPTQEVARRAISDNSAIIVCDDSEAVVDVINACAPEHLSLHDPDLLPRVTNAGSIFLGPWSTEAVGDYVSGPNHVLPTMSVATVRGGLSVNDFLKVITVQQLDRDALASVAAATATLARAEGLEAHARSVEVRLDA
jgi:histidinol dehydrogenase